MSSFSKTAVTTGAQSVERAVLLLRLIAGQGSRGARISELVAAAQLRRPTVHRILSVLRSERLVEVNPVSKRYRLGTTMFEFGLAAPSPVERLDKFRPMLQQLAAETADTAYLVMRTGDEAACLAIEEGEYPIRARTFEIGARRPLGVGAAGLALIAELPDKQIDEIILRRGHLIQRANISLDNLRQRVASTRAQGYAVSQNTITAGVTGIGRAVRIRNGLSFLSVSVAAISSRIPESRIPRVVQSLGSAARAIEDQLSD